MQLSKTSWIVKIAYTFDDELPEKVDRCILWKWCGLMLIPWIILNFVAWIFFGIILGIVAQPILRVILFLFVGQKLVSALKDDDTGSSIIYKRQLGKLTVVTYKRENIWWLNWTEMDGFRCPIAALLCYIGAFGLVAAGVYRVPDVIQLISDGVTSAGTVAYTTIGWWGSALLAIAAIAAVIYLGKKGYRAFAATESGAMIVAHIKGWQDKYCTVYELV